MLNKWYGLFAVLIYLSFANIPLTAEENESTPHSPLNAGMQVTKGMAPNEAQTFTLQTNEGDFVRGQLNGLKLKLVLRNRTGQEIRILASGRSDQQEFQFVVGDDAPYSLEIRAGEGGQFSLTIEMIVARDAQRSPTEVLESPKLRQLQRTLSQGGSTTTFWRDVEQNQAPLIEDNDVLPPLAKETVLVTFLWRGAQHGVRLFGAPSGMHEDLKQLGTSDVWYGSYRVPDTSRISYKLAPDVPQLNASAMIRRRAILATAQRDPFNPKQFPSHELSDKYAGESVVELPTTPQPAWRTRKEGVPEGDVEHHRISSSFLNNARDIHVYRPHGFERNRGEHALIVVFDGERYLDEVELPRTLDNLIAAKEIPPTVAVLISNPSPEARSAELPPNPLFVRFLVEELMPWVQDQHLSAPANKTVVLGASYGGLAAAYAGFMHPELFGNVYSQSGSFWWSPESIGRGRSQIEPEWLARQYAVESKKAVNFFLEAGLFEVGGPGITMLETTRHLRDVLQAKGNQVQYQEFAGGHGYFYWRNTVGNGLVALLGKSQTLESKSKP